MPRYIFQSLLLVCSAVLARETGTHQFCAGGRLHSLAYDTQLAVDSDSIVEVDSLSGLKDLQCDVDGSQLKIIFHDEIHSTALWAKIKLGNVYLTGGEEHGCPLKVDQAKGFLLRRVNTASLDGQAVNVQTSQAQYDEIYEDASIKYGSSKSDECLAAQADKQICVGVNADPTCTQAAAPIPVYTNGLITLTCDNCFAGISLDVFFDIKIKGFQLNSIEGGFRNITAESQLDLNLLATKSWSAGIDKTLPIAGGENNPIVSFKLGSVPFIFWFEVNQQITGDATLQTTAQASAGVKAQYNIGDSYVSWDPDNHWQTHKPDPQLVLTPSVSGSASFSGQADFRLTPSLKLHVNQLFSYTLQINPGMNMNIQGDTSSKQICESVAYDVELTSQADLHLNINWANIHDDMTWGPKSIWAKNGTVSQVCVGASAVSPLRD